MIADIIHQAAAHQAIHQAHQAHHHAAHQAIHQAHHHVDAAVAKISLFTLSPSERVKMKG